jgi:ADP-ribose pyrophosphatase
VFEDAVDLPDGGRIDDFIRLEGREVAIAFALTEDQLVLIVEQHKYGAQTTVLQLPAGYLEAGEAAEAGAQRELLEETGYEAPVWQPLGSYWMDANRGFGLVHLFLACDAWPVREPVHDESEQLVLHRVSLESVEQMLQDGTFAELSMVAGVSLALLRLRSTGKLTSKP